MSFLMDSSSAFRMFGGSTSGTSVEQKSSKPRLKDNAELRDTIISMAESGCSKEDIIRVLEKFLRPFSGGAPGARKRLSDTSQKARKAVTKTKSACEQGMRASVTSAEEYGIANRKEGKVQERKVERSRMEGEEPKKRETKAGESKEIKEEAKKEEEGKTAKKGKDINEEDEEEEKGTTVEEVEEIKPEARKVEREETAQASPARERGMSFLKTRPTFSSAPPPPPVHELPLLLSHSPHDLSIITDSFRG